VDTPDGQSLSGRTIQAAGHRRSRGEEYLNELLLAESAIELRRRIGSKEVSPVELLEACIARIERINPAVNAVTATCYDRAREEARAAEKAALRGEPLGLQVISRFRGDRALLGAAHAMEQAFAAMAVPLLGGCVTIDFSAGTGRVSLPRSGTGRRSAAMAANAVVI
jgi:hypothetical protein